MKTPITSAEAEKRFSKLNIIKTYLRSSGYRERLNGLATLAVEREESENISYENIIETFSTKKRRKIRF